MTDFTIMQWNTLANSLCDNKGFPKIEEKYLETEYRRNL
jgi:mRNA deadenylase 3'-5' endonuclease subunit Ccr4